MGCWSQRLAVACLVLCLQSALAAADPDAGVAAYDAKDYAKALKLLKPEAEQGDPEAQVRYGLIFAKSLGVPHDGAEALKWFQKAAAQGNARAMYCIGVSYDLGDAGSKDPAKAVEWYRKAAEKGYATAQYNLGQMLQKGDGVPADPEESAKWLQKAADQGEAGAEFYLAIAYLKGLGVEKDFLSVRYWAERAEKHGAKDADTLAEIVRKEFKRAETEDKVPRTTGGDGTSFERAVAMPDMKTEADGIHGEHTVTNNYLPGWHWVSQALLQGPDNRPFDEITLEKDGKQRKLYFDVSNFFGKLE